MHDYVIEVNNSHHFAYEDGEYHVLESAVYNSQLKDGLYKVAVGQSEHITTITTTYFYKIENVL